MGALDGWSEFNVAMVGATAALTGLVIVAASVNIGEIVKTATIPARLAAAIAGLVLALSASALALIPGLTVAAYAIVLGVLAVGTGAFGVHAAVVIVRDRSPEARARFLKSALGFLPVAYYAAAAVVVVPAPAAGLLLAAAACILSVATAVVISWVALVEVLR
jgi:hypothetical protein